VKVIGCRWRPGPFGRTTLAATLRGVTKPSGAIEPVPIGALPNDGKVVADER
jgi:phenylacetate-CoA ligase